MGHEGSLFGLPPVPNECGLLGRVIGLGGFGEENVESLASNLVESVPDRATKEAGSWLVSTISQKGLEGLRPLLEKEKDLMAVMNESLSGSDEVERWECIGQFKGIEVEEVYSSSGDDDLWD